MTTRSEPKEVGNDLCLTEFIHDDARRARDRAMNRVATVRSSTTLAALAQAHAILGERTAAIDAARAALVLSGEIGVSQRDRWLDSSSARIAVEVLLRFNDADYAYRRLRKIPAPPSLCITVASAAIAVGKRDEAEHALNLHDGWMTDAFRGYIHVHFREFDKAIPHLRRALRNEPNDVDSLFNLAIAWWNIGAVDKATQTALRAARIGLGRQDVLQLYLEILLATHDINRLIRELDAIELNDIRADARLLEIQGCAHFLRGDLRTAYDLFMSAMLTAQREHDKSVERRNYIAASAIRLMLEF